MQADLKRLLLGAIWIVGVGLTAQENANPANAAGILQKMAQRYASLTSYQDDGVVISKTPIQGRRTPFTIQFSRPAFFRFQWNTVHAFQPFRVQRFNYEIRSDGNQVWFLHPESGDFETRPRLSEVINQAAGVSSGSAHTVPRMLMEDIGGFSLLELIDLKILRQELFEGVVCWVVQGDHPTTSKWTYTVWIGVSDYLLRKMDFKLGEEIHRNIRIDRGIDPHHFEAPESGD